MALLEACQAWHAAPQLLHHLTALHVEATAQWLTAGGAAAAAAATALDGGPLLWHRLRVQPGVVLGALESMADRWATAVLPIHPAAFVSACWGQVDVLVATANSLDTMTCRLVALGLLASTLDLMTSWAMRYGAPAASGRRHLGRATQAAGTLLAAGIAADAPGVRPWWDRCDWDRVEVQNGTAVLAGRGGHSFASQ